jgi:polyribonucleotide nucleotidyltransferase
VEDDGTVTIACLDAAGAEEAKRRVEALCQEIKVGNVYDGKVTSIKEFGAFIEITPGRDGLCHISELDTGYVGRVDDVVKVGDRVQVKVIAIDDQDRVKLSRKALMQGAEGGDNGERPERGDRGERGEGRRERSERGEGRRDRGGDRGEGRRERSERE